MSYSYKVRLQVPFIVRRTYYILSYPDIPQIYHISSLLLYFQVTLIYFCMYIDYHASSVCIACVFALLQTCSYFMHMKKVRNSTFMFRWSTLVGCAEVDWLQPWAELLWSSTVVGGAAMERCSWRACDGGLSHSCPVALWLSCSAILSHFCRVVQLIKHPVALSFSCRVVRNFYIF